MKNVALLPICMVVGLVGCGGGSGSSQEQANTKSVVSGFNSSALSSPVASSIAAETDEKIGYFKDASVIGMPYIACNANNTKCIESHTGMDGSYLYREGYTVRFYIGDLQILDTEAKSLITPINSMPSHAQAEQLAQVLLSLDSDDDPSNGLDISEAAKNISKNTSLGITNLVNATPEQIGHAITVIKPGATVVESSVAGQHLEMSKRLEFDSGRQSFVSQWILNKKKLPPSVNTDLLYNNTDARVRYALWSQLAPKFLAKTDQDLITSMSSIELAKKASDTVFEGLEMALDALSLHSAVKALKASGDDVFIKGLKIAEDGSALLVDLLSNGKKLQVRISPDAKELDEQSESYVRAALSALTGNPISSSANALKGLTESNEGAALVLDITEKVLDTVNDSLKENNWNFTNNFKLSGSQLTKAASAVQTLLLADSLYQDTAHAKARIAAFDYLDAQYSSGSDLIWMKKNRKIDSTYIKTKGAEISRAPVLGNIMASTLIESAIAHAQDQIEESYDAVVTFYGGSLDTVNASFEGGNADVVACKNSQLVETIDIQRSKNVYTTPTNYSVHWEIPGSISTITVGTKASLQFTESGFFKITAYVARTSESVPKVITKFFEVRDCTNNGSSKYSSSASSKPPSSRASVSSSKASSSTVIVASSKAASSSLNASSIKSSAVASSSQKIEIESLSHGNSVLRTEDNYTFTAKLTGPASRVTIQFDSVSGSPVEMHGDGNYNWTRDRIFDAPGKKSILVIAFDKGGNKIAMREFEKTVIAQKISILKINHAVKDSSNIDFKVTTKGKPARVRIRYDKNGNNYFDMNADGDNQWISTRKFNTTGAKEVTVQAYNGDDVLIASEIYRLTVD